MKPPRPRLVPPPFPGRVVYGEVLEVICEEEKAGRPRAPLVELLSPRLRPEDEAELRAAPADAPPAPQPE